ncbi:cobalt-precorrin 5A hydrolase / precorrin-3B C17-methyltransferase [Micromonospora pattaloongensis]|uniref:Cobalt-precorrin 5A hydrolase / precorrin-3B C17-methyltransferase n=1 Tax=Micromonospora pattaloongensis TaxID=405436 RepID=A0A1H3NTJ8_9ACTN|nr:precorrin-3B C(17)-methyltransferase [Micromonospora pattaloongensis]SDY92247.1 cobalt-precorrin 5A hydrolase / precorrin-3B C17-methyltransferase [Micromonospora pattaloongensis]
MTKVIGLVAATAAGRAAADRLADAWPGRTRRYAGTVAEQLRAAWSDCGAIVCFLAVPATVRLAAPLLRDKDTDPGVVCVDEAGRYAVPVLGGHGGGANGLAAAVGEVLGAEPVVTTGTDAVGRTPLDSYGSELGFRLPDPTAVAAVTRAVLDGAALRVEADAVWPLPPLVTAAPAPYTLAVTDRADVAADLVYRPPSLVVGVGASRGAPADELDALIDAALADAALVPESVRALATADVKADEPGIVEVARRRGWPLLTYPAAELAAEAVPNPSEVVRAAVGTPSVAEAAALRAARAAGRAAALVVEKRAAAMSTVAVARLTPRGRLTVVGLGPGAADLRTPRATAALRRAAVVVGLDQYVDQIRPLLTAGTRVLASGLGAEEERARTAVTLATEGHAVALIGSGDAGVYAMASPALQVAGADVDVEVVPGVTAALAAAALLGAPLGHDHAYLSLSDLHTPWAVIADRLRACAEADLVVSLYNPRSRRRTAQFDEALAILGKHRPASTPVGVVRDATRPGERVVRTTLRALADDPSIVDMLSVVVVGSSRTATVAGRIVTPREYRWLP